MKFSDLQSDESGREVVFTALNGDQRFRVVISREILDDECASRADADEAERHAWVEEHMPNILEALLARTEGGTVGAPFNRIFVEEID